MKLKEFYTDESKWTKYTFYNMYGACCLMGALTKCYPTSGHIGMDMRLDVERKLQKAIIDRSIANGTGKIVDSIISWNDASERTFEEVKALVEELDV